MRLLEYQAKELFSEFGIKTPKGLTSKDFEQGKKDAKGQVKKQNVEVNVGRVKLFLLDTNLPSNTEQDRLITSALYAGGSEMRIQQEIQL